MYLPSSLLLTCVVYSLADEKRSWTDEDGVEVEVVKKIPGTRRLYMFDSRKCFRFQMHDQERTGRSHRTVL